MSHKYRTIYILERYEKLRHQKKFRSKDESRIEQREDPDTLFSRR